MRVTSRYRHVIWDWNGTLVDDVTVCVATINHLLGTRALPCIDLERYRQVFDFPVRRYYERLGFEFETESFEQTCADFISHYRTLWRQCGLRSGAVEVLRRLTELGISHSVLSATEQTMLLEQAAQHALLDAIPTWIGTEDTLAHGKLEQGRRWLAQHSSARSQVLLVGDTLHDLEVAAELGVDCVLVEGGHHDRERLRASGAPVCPDLHAVFATITSGMPRGSRGL